MKAVSGKEMCKVLEKSGWQLERIHSSHHIYKKHGVPMLIAVPVHGNKTLSPGVQRSIMRTAGLMDADL